METAFEVVTGSIPKRKALYTTYNEAAAKPTDLHGFCHLAES